MMTAPNISPHPNAPDMAGNEVLVVQTLRLLPAEGLFRVLSHLPVEILRTALDMRLARDAAAQPKPSPAPPPPAPAATAPPPAAPAQATANPAEKRRSTRHRTLRGAKIIFNNRISVVDAQVRDISDGGCRLRVATAAHLPQTFNLQISGMMGEKRCEVRWRHESELGVRFLD